MTRRNRYADMLAARWYNHTVLLAGEEKRTGIGIIKGEPVEVKADVDATTRVVATESGEETTIAATVTWHRDGPVPKTGQTLTLPDQFGFRPDRQIVTVRVQDSGTGLTPDHIEVTVR